MVKKYYPSLDGLRGFSALAVLAFHTAIASFWLGWIGVQFFFVLSGFLITNILIDSKKSINYFKTFYARRSLRIFPIYFLILVVVFTVAIKRKMVVDDVWLYIFYLQNFKLSFHNWAISFPNWLNHTWSLAIEEQFYIFFPFLVYFLKEKILIIFCFVLIFLAIFTRYFLSIKFPANSIVWANTLSNLDFLSAGALISIGLKNDKFKIINIVLSFLFGSVLLCSVLFRASFKKPIDLTSLSGQLFLVLLLIFASLVILNIVTRNNILFRVLFENKYITYIGKISYGLYLYHFTLYILMDYIGKHYGLLFFNYGIGIYLFAVFKFMLTFVVAVFSYNFIEKKISKLKSNFIYKFQFTL